MHPPIIALHGNFGSTEGWADFPISNVKAVDLWQHANLSFPDFADWLVAEHGSETDPPILMGYSLGGRLVLNTMALYPDRWRGAILLSAHPGLQSVAEKEARLASDQEWARRVKEEPWEDVIRDWNEQAVLADSPPLFGSDDLEDKKDQLSSAFDNWSLGRQVDLKASLGRFTSPVLWVTGENDEKFTSLGSSMAQVFSDFRHAVVAGCGHRILNEEGAQIVNHWLAERFSH